jgi:hypothetical protein
MISPPDRAAPPLRSSAAPSGEGLEKSTDVATEPVVAPRKSASVLKVVRDQRKTVLVALGLAVAAYWIVGQLGEWLLATCLAIGIGLGLVNHLATEYWLLKIITSGEQPTRNAMMRSTLVRLGVLAVVAIGAAALLWPDGIGLLLGLAIFRLIALVLTSVPLLKELKKP